MADFGPAAESYERLPGRAPDFVAIEGHDLAATLVGSRPGASMRATRWRKPAGESSIPFVQVP